jgi:hypothetical protein
MMVNIAFKTDGMVEDCDKVMSSSNRIGTSDYYAEFINDRIVLIPRVYSQECSHVFKEWYNTNYVTLEQQPQGYYQPHR